MRPFARIAVLTSPLTLISLSLQLANPASRRTQAVTTRRLRRKPQKIPTKVSSRMPAGPSINLAAPHATDQTAQAASNGELFWYITEDNLNNGMPSWKSLPEKDRWQIINFLRVLGGSKPGSPRVRPSADEAVATATAAPPPKAPFTDYRYEKIG